MVVGKWGWASGGVGGSKKKIKKKRESEYERGTAGVAPPSGEKWDRAEFRPQPERQISDVTDGRKIQHTFLFHGLCMQQASRT